MRKFLRIVLFLILVVIALSIAAVLYVQSAFTTLLRDYAKEHYGLTLKIGSAELRFSPLSVRLNQIEVSSTGKPAFLKVQSAYAAVPYSSLWENEVVVQEVSIDSPDLDVNSLPQFPKEPRSSVGSRTFRIETLVVRSGSLQIRDYKVKGFQLRAGIDSGGSKVQQVEAECLGLRISAQGAIKNWSDPQADFNYSISGDLSQFAKIYPPIKSVKGSFSAKGEIHGPPSGIVVSGQTGNITLSVGDYKPFTANAAYHIAPGEADQPLTLDVKWQSLPLAIAHEYWEDAPSVVINTTSNGVAHYSGGWDLFGGSGTVQAQILSDSRGLSGQIEGALDNHQLRIRKGSFRVGSSSIEATGFLAENDLFFSAIVRSRRLADFAALYRKAGSIPGSWVLKAEASGPYRSIQVKGELFGDTGHSAVHVIGRARPDSRQIYVDFNGSAAAVDLHSISPEISEGELHFDGSLKGNRNNPQLNAKIEGSALQVSGISLGDLSGQLEGGLNRLQFQASLPGYGTTAAGSYAYKSGKFQIDGRVEDLSVDEVRPLLPPDMKDLSGSVTGAFHGAGDLDHWKESNAHFQIENAAFRWQHAELVLEEGSNLGLENGSAAIDIQATTKQGSLKAHGLLPLNPDGAMELNLEASVSAGILEKLNDQWKADGTASLEAQLKGSRNHPEAFGSLAADNLTITFIPKKMTFHIDQANAKFSGEKVEFNGSGNYNSARLQWNSMIPLDESPGFVHAEIASLLLQEIQPDLPLTGRVDVVADMQGAGFPLKQWEPGKGVNLPFHEWVSKITITPSDLKFSEYPILVQAPLQLTLADRILRLAPCKFTSGDMLDFQAGGSVNLEKGEIDASAKMAARIDMLSGLKADIRSSGPLTADLSVSGPLNQPRYDGNLRLSNASLRIPGSPLSFEKIELTASFNQERIRIDKLEARSGGGTVTGGGELVRGATVSSIWLTGRKVAMIYPEGLRSQSNCDLKLTAAGDRLVLSGDVILLRSFYDQELTFRNPLLRKLLASQTQLARDKYMKSKVSLAVNVRTEDDFVLQNTLTELRAGGNLKVEGTLYQPKINGQIRIREGSRIFIAGKTYVVEKAKLDFFSSELLEPNLDLELSTLMEDSNNNTFYETFVRIGGPLSDITIRNVRSTPSLSESQIFDLLIHGSTRETSAGAASSGEAFREQIISAVTGQVLAVPASRVARTVGLSRVNVQQEGLNSVNDSKTRLVLAKDVGAGFSIIYSFVLNEPQEYTWVAAYRYQNRFFMRYIGQDDGTYTASINHRIVFGTGASSPSFSGGRAKRFQSPIVASLDISNQSPLSEKEIRDIISSQAGSRYDYWTFSDRLERLKRTLQTRGYLSPSVEIDETELDGNRVSLRLEVLAGEAGEMRFRGYDVSDKIMSHYFKWWAQGISPLVVQGMIQEDLTRQLNKAGYQKAVVDMDSESSEGRMIYSFNVTPGPLFKTVELKFQGIQAYSPASLQKELRGLFPSTGDMLTDAVHDPFSVVDKIRVLYAQRGYASATVAAGPLTIPDNGGRILREFDIREGEPVRVVSVATPGDSIPDELRATLLVQTGRHVILQDFLDDEVAICSYFENRGYQDCSAQYNIELMNQSRELAVSWMVEKGEMARVASVQIIGSEATREQLILKQIGLRKGDVLTPHNQSLAQKRLYDLGVFQEVSLDKTKTDTAGLYDVTVRVVENKRYELQYGARYNNEDKLGAEVRITDYNLLGRAHQLSFYGRSDPQEPLFRLDYILPRTGMFWDALRFSLFRDDRDDEVTGTYNHQEITLPYALKESQVQVQQTRPLGIHHQVIWDFSYGPETLHTQQTSEFNELAIRGRRALFHLALVGDFRDDSLDATSGYFYSLDGQSAPALLGADILYDKTYGQFFFYHRLGPIVLASAVRAGFLHARSDIFTLGEKFRSGGSTTLRGFDLNEVHPATGLLGVLFGGDSVFLINEEIRFPIYKWLRGAAFYDGGNVYETVQDFDPTNLRNSAGFGFRLGGGGFLLRFDLGFNLDPQPSESHSVFYFAIGQAF